MSIFAETLKKPRDYETKIMYAYVKFIHGELSLR